MILLSEFIIYYQNFRGLKTKLHNLRLAAQLNNYDVIIGTETWLDDSVNDGELFDSRYIIYRRDRASTPLGSKKGGGVLIAVSRAIDSTRVTKWESDAEDLWVKLKTDSGKGNLYICAAYLPPPVQHGPLNLILDNVDAVIESTGGDVIIAGDFNLGSIDWSTDNTLSSSPCTTARNFANRLGYSLVDFMSSNSIKQINTVRNCYDRTLDLILCNFHGGSVSECKNPLSLVDVHHPPLDIAIKNISPAILKSKSSLKYNFWKANYALVNERLRSIDWASLFSDQEDVDLMVDTFYTQLNRIVDECVPRYNRRNKKFPAWFSKCLIRLLNEKEKLRLRFKKYKNPRDKYEYRILEDRSKTMIKKCYSTYVNNTEDNIRLNPKAFWSFVKAKKAKSNDIPSEMYWSGKVANSGEEVSKLFASHFSATFAPPAGTVAVQTKSKEYPQLALGSHYFTERDILKELKKLNTCKGPGPDGLPPHFIRQCAKYLSLPLKLIFNKSLMSSKFPTQWKIAHVVPIFKKGEPNDVKNYRPISLLSIFSKLFESLICPVLTSLIKTQLATQQHGFCTNKSTTTNLVHYINDISRSVDSGVQVDSIYTDFSSAFDKVNHVLLLQKLANYGMHGHLLRWFESYLSDRQQRVVIKGYQSPLYHSTSGVPQGSHLGPILFLVFVNDIIHSIKNSKCSMFADDLKLYKEIESSTDIALLQKDLDAIHEWCHSNMMTLNAAKCYHITFTRKKLIQPSAYHLNGITLQKVDTIRDLGVQLDSQLSFINHFDTIVAKANKMSGFVKRTCKEFRSIGTLKVLYNSLVRSILEYASPAWNPAYRVHIDRIECIQKKFTRYLRYRSQTCNREADYPQRLCHFKMSSLEQRRSCSDLIFLYKTLHNLANVPELVSEIGLIVSRRTSYRSNFKTETFQMPKTRTNLGRSAPLYRLLSSYNKLSTRTNNLDIFSNSLNEFRRYILSS